jgi:hypothetical protein
VLGASPRSGQLKRTGPEARPVNVRATSLSCQPLLLPSGPAQRPRFRLVNAPHLRPPPAAPRRPATCHGGRPQRFSRRRLRRNRAVVGRSSSTRARAQIATTQTTGTDEREEHDERVSTRPRTSAVAVVDVRRGSAPADRPEQERRSWRPARSLAREGGRGVMSRLSPRHRAFHGAGVAGHAAPPPRGTAPVCRRSARQGFPSVRSIRLAWWSTGPRCGLTDDFSAPCWSVRRIPTHGRLTPCGN